MQEASRRLNRLSLIFAFLTFVVMSALLFAPGVAFADGAGSIYVQDKASVLSDSTEKYVRDANKRMEAGRKHAQLLVVTMNTLPKGKTIENEANDLFNKYGVGGKSDDGQDSNGILYLLVTKTHQHRLEVGYGLEDDITDAKAQSIIDNVTSYYKENPPDYDAGVRKVTDDVAKYAKTGQLSSTDEEQPPVPLWKKILVWIGVIVGIFIGFPLLLILGDSCGYYGSSSGSRGSSFGGGSSGGGGASGGW